VRQARRDLTEANLRLVVSVARPYAWSGIPLPDLVQRRSPSSAALSLTRTLSGQIVESIGMTRGAVPLLTEAIERCKTPARRGPRVSALVRAARGLTHARVAVPPARRNRTDGEAA
jgi:hypothetical protein